MENQNISIESINITAEKLKEEFLNDKDVLALAGYADRLNELQGYAEQSNDAILFLVIYKFMARIPSSPQWRQAHVWLMKAALYESITPKIKKAIIDELEKYVPLYLNWLEEQVDKEPSVDKLLNLVTWYINPIFLIYKLRSIEIYNFKKSFALIKHAASIKLFDTLQTLKELFKNSSESLKLDFARLFYLLSLEHRYEINVTDFEEILKFLIKEDVNEKHTLEYLIYYIKYLGQALFAFTDIEYKALAEATLKYPVLQHAILVFSLQQANTDIIRLANTFLAMALASPEIIFIEFSAPNNLNELQAYHLLNNIKKINELNHHLSLIENINEKNSIWNESIAFRRNCLSDILNQGKLLDEILPNMNEIERIDRIKNELKTIELPKEQPIISNLLDMINWQLAHDLDFLIKVTQVEPTKKHILPLEILVKIDKNTRLLFKLALAPDSEEYLISILQRRKFLKNVQWAELYYKTAKILRVRNSSLIKDYLLNDAEFYADNKLKQIKNEKNFQYLDFACDIDFVRAYILTIVPLKDLLAKLNLIFKKAYQ